MAMDHEDHPHPSLQLRPSSSAGSSLDLPQLSDDANGLAPNSAKRTLRSGSGKKTESNKRSRTNESFGEDISNQVATLPAIPQNSLSQSSSSSSSITPQEKNDFESLQQAAAGGDMIAQRNLAHTYWLGRAPGGKSEANYAECFKWLRFAAKQGDMNAQGNCGRMYKAGQALGGKSPKNDLKALKWLTKSAEQGDKVTQFELECMYKTGRVLGGTSPENNAEAVRLLSQAAAKGDAAAQCCLGYMYMAGRVPEGRSEANDVEAVKLLRPAAKKGNVIAQYNLGVMYMTGRGVEGGTSLENSLKAIEWLKKAKNQGHREAEDKLKAMLGLQRGRSNTMSIYL